MITLTLVLSLLAAEPKKCSTGCATDFKYGPDVATCFYRLKTKCDRGEFECKDTPRIACEPVYVDIGVDEYREQGLSLKRSYSYDYGYSR